MNRYDAGLKFLGADNEAAGTPHPNWLLNGQLAAGSARTAIG